VINPGRWVWIEAFPNYQKIGIERGGREANENLMERLRAYATRKRTRHQKSQSSETFGRPVTFENIC
jgi:hypothetical protein